VGVFTKKRGSRDGDACSRRSKCGNVNYGGKGAPETVVGQSKEPGRRILRDRLTGGPRLRRQSRSCGLLRVVIVGKVSEEAPNTRAEAPMLLRRKSLLSGEGDSHPIRLPRSAAMRPVRANALRRKRSFFRAEEGHFASKRSEKQVN